MAASDGFSIFEYVYRDAGNYKAFGQVLLRGECVDAHWRRIEAACDSHLLFVAEQVGVPPLYEELYAYSGGMVAGDHAFHEARKLRLATAEEAAGDAWGPVAELVARFAGVGNEWDCRLSPHGCLLISHVP